MMRYAVVLDNGTVAILWEHELFINDVASLISIESVGFEYRA